MEKTCKKITIKCYTVFQKTMFSPDKTLRFHRLESQNYQVNLIDQEMGERKDKHKPSSPKDSKNAKAVDLFKKKLWDFVKNSIINQKKWNKSSIVFGDLQKEVAILEHQLEVFQELVEKNPIRQTKDTKIFFIDLNNMKALFKNKNFAYHKIKKKKIGNQQDLHWNLKLLKEYLLNIRLSNAHAQEVLEKKKHLLTRIEKLLKINQKLFNK